MLHSPKLHTNLLNVFVQIANNKRIKKTYCKTLLLKTSHSLLRGLQPAQTFEVLNISECRSGCLSLAKRFAVAMATEVLSMRET
jgi:protein involved in sex pheromone biosynthesis